MKNTIFLLLIISLSSCSFVRKIKDNHKEKRQEKTHHVKDSVSQSNTDSTHVLSSDSVNVKKEESKKESWWSIDIDTTEASTVEITQDSTGKQTIKATGKISKVLVKSSQTENKTDSTRQLKEDSTASKSSQSVSLHETASAERKEIYTHKETKKTSVRFGWWWLIIPVGVYLALKHWPKIIAFIRKITTGL